MARSITAGTDDIHSSSIIAPPLTTGTISFWFNPNWNSGNGIWQEIFFYYLSSSTTLRLELLKYLDNNVYFGWLNPGTSVARVTFADTGLFTSGTWTNIALTWNGATPLQTAYFNAVSKGTDASCATASLPTLDRLEFGNAHGTANTQPANGSFAEFALWDKVLDASELSALARGYSPLLVRTSALLTHFPLIGRTSPEIEIISGNSGTLIGTSAVPHPRIIMPRSKISQQTKVAAVYVYMRPDADQSDGSWLNELGTNINLYASVDETVASDADYIQSSTTSGDKVRLQLSNPGSGVAQPFAIRYRASATTVTASLFGRLYQGVTLIDSWNHTVTTTSTDYTHTVGSTEFALISDFNDLFIEFEYTP